MEKLIQTNECSIIYGDFRGEYQELFRCPREFSDTDLKRYVSENRCLLGFTEVNDVTDLKAAENFLGYYRLYFRGCWYGRWMDNNEKITKLDCVGIDIIVRWLQETFPNGCSWGMREYLMHYQTWDGNNRYLLKPLYSDHYKIMFDTTYGNGDYPVRIYVYE